jgi:hypothetical protein
VPLGQRFLLPGYTRETAVRQQATRQGRDLVFLTLKGARIPIVADQGGFPLAPFGCLSRNLGTVPMMAGGPSCDRR